MTLVSDFTRQARDQPVGTHFITFQEVLRKESEGLWVYVETPAWGNVGNDTIGGVMYAFANDPQPNPLEAWSFS